MQASYLGTRIAVKNILFATDLSYAAAAAVPYVVGIAKVYGAKVCAVHVKTGEWDRMQEEEVERLKDRLRSVAHEFVVEQGDIRTVLMGLVGTKQSDLLVVGTHGRAGIGRVLIGSLAESLFREAPCPVLTVGSRHTNDPSWTVQIKEVLLATDLESASGEATRYAISLAQENQARLTILNVAPSAEPNELVESKHFEDSTLRRLKALIAPEVELWCEPYYMVEVGNAAEKILDVAGSYHADMIVLGIRPHSVALATHLSRPTAHRVVAGATCPVLTVRSSG